MFIIIEYYYSLFTSVHLIASHPAEDPDVHFLSLSIQDASGEPMVGPCPGSDVTIQGYLFKRSRRKSKTWKRFRRVSSSS